MKWSKEGTTEFLELFKNEPVLWESCSKRNKQLRDSNEAWRRIQLKLGSKFSVEDLKRKKRSLMATYRACVKRINKCDARGIEGNKPKWFAYETMTSFLGEASGQKNVRGSMDVSEDVERGSEPMDPDDEMELQNGPQYPDLLMAAPVTGYGKFRGSKNEDKVKQFATFVISELRQLPIEKAIVLRQEIRGRIVRSEAGNLYSIENLVVEHSVELCH